MATIVVTLDFGGSGVKASAFDVDLCLAVASTVGRYPPHVDADAGTFDPHAWMSSALTAARILVDKIGQPQSAYLGMTVTAIRAPFVLLDQWCDVLRPSLLNRDRRANPQVRWLAATVGEAALYQITGHWPAPQFGLPKMLWMRDTHRATWNAATRVLQLHDWFVYRLCGGLASEPSSAAMSQVLDVTSRTWADDLLGHCQLDVDLFPDLLPSGTIVGGLRPELAPAIGLPSGLPIHLGGGDTHFSTMAAGGLNELMPVVVAGSTAPTQLALNRVSDPPDLSATNPLLVSELAQSSGWALEANAGPTGAVINRLAGLTGETDHALRSELIARGFDLVDGAEDHGELTVLAGNPFFGPLSWCSAPVQSIAGLRPDHTGADVKRQALRSTCIAVTSVLDSLRHHTVAPGQAIAVTGGMSTNADWNQTLADVSGRPVRVRPLDRLAGLAGAAVVAGPDVLTSLSDIRSTLFEPADVDGGEGVDELARYRDRYRTAQVAANQRDLRQTR
jgi:xylulokinase